MSEVKAEGEDVTAWSPEPCSLGSLTVSPETLCYLAKVTSNCFYG